MRLSLLIIQHKGFSSISKEDGLSNPLDEIILNEALSNCNENTIRIVLFVAILKLDITKLQH